VRDASGNPFASFLQKIEATARPAAFFAGHAKIKK